MKEKYAVTTPKRKKQVALAVGAYREKQKATEGRKQSPVMLTDIDKANMALIKQHEPDVRNQGEAISKALSEFVKKYKVKK